MERISQLLYKQLQGKLTEAEHAELMAWATTDPANWELLNRVIDEESLEANIRDWYAIPRRSVADDPRLDAAIAEYEAASKHPHLYQLVKRILPYAAAIIIVATAGIWYAVEQRKNKVYEIAAEEVATGGNKALLTLTDGRKIDLSAEQSGIIVGDGHITYSNGSALADLSDEEDPDDNIQLELATPKGGTYCLTLPDGSKVWLNAASSIKYPSRFSGKERAVELNGEAYFNIEEDKNHPFKVLSKGQEVQVLGTAFNIEAYLDENETKTTLVTGKVHISPMKDAGDGSRKRHKPVVLAPGEQGLLRNGQITKSEVDVFVYTAWKDGFFYFNRVPTSIAITQLARWYDLDVVYEGKIPNANVFANIDRRKPLRAVLTALEKSGLQFKVMQSGQRKKLIVLGEQ